VGFLLFLCSLWTIPHLLRHIIEVLSSYDMDDGFVLG